MWRLLLRCALYAGLSPLLLAACGGEGLGGSAAEPLGTHESAVCSGLRVSDLTITGVSSYLGEASGGGNWSVAAPANAVRLEYYVDGVQRTFEERTGGTGPWYFSKDGIACGTHTFEVRAFPMVIDSAGNRSTCSDAPVSRTQGFSDTSCQCVIGGKTYRDGQKDPQTECSICRVSQSRTSWTFNPSGYADKKGICKPLTSGGNAVCVSSARHTGESCILSSDCYTRCNELD
ncbi:MAG: hypothetical protein ABW123_23620 [Cystobacter sp.]